MAQVQGRTRQAPGSQEYLFFVNPQSLIARKVAPTGNTHAEQSTIYVQDQDLNGANVNAVWLNAGKINGQDQWVQVAPGGGAGVFSSLTVNPGPTNLSTVGNGDVTIGNAANTGLVLIEAGVGGFSVEGNGHAITIGIDGAANQVAVGSLTAGAQTSIQGGNGTGILTGAVVILAAAAGDITVGNTTQTGILRLGTSTTTGQVLIGGTAGTGQITVGSSSAAQTVAISAGAGAGVVQIADAQAAGSVSVGAGMTTGTISVGGTGLQTGAISIAPGTGAQAVHIADNTGAKTVTIGNVGNNTSVIIRADNSGTSHDAILLNANGYVTLALTPVTSGSAAPTVNGRVGQLIATGFTTASAASQVWTITNDVCQSGSPVFVTVSNNGTNDAQMTLQRVETAANTLTVTVKNNGAAAVNGNVYINFWIYD